MRTSGKLRQELLDFYDQNPGEDSLYEFLHEIDLIPFAETDRCRLTELLISEGMSREAFRWRGSTDRRSEPSFLW
ncbi:MAG: DUF5717 family protein [Blautia sp.]